MAQRILGLDLGAHAVKAVLLESTFRGYVVLDAISAVLPEGAPEPHPPTPPSPRGGEGGIPGRHAAAARELIAEHGWSFDVAVVAFPGAGLSTNVVTLPFLDPRRIQQTIG